MPSDPTPDAGQKKMRTMTLLELAAHHDREIDFAPESSSATARDGGPTACFHRDAAAMLREREIEIACFRAALEDIANPLIALRAEAERQGARLNGHAVTLCDNANWLKEKARKALAHA